MHGMTFANKHHWNLHEQEPYSSINNTMGVTPFTSMSLHSEANAASVSAPTTTEGLDKSCTEPVSLTLYLIRHGEASHNVLEKMAKQKALEESLAEGLCKDDTLTKERMERARQEVLLDHTLFDAPLSDHGKLEAKHANVALRMICRQHELLPPQEVLVSPLTRTLETANLIFPENDNVHVREELRERCTGKPPDTRSSAEKLRSRCSFARFSMTRLEELTLLQQQTLQAQQEEEDRAMLRERTHQIFNLLAESSPKTKSIAVVTHKGYLRELERGPFGQPTAIEFQNCEIRVYQLRFHPDSDEIDYAHRIV